MCLVTSKPIVDTILTTNDHLCPVSTISISNHDQTYFDISHSDAVVGLCRSAVRSDVVVLGFTSLSDHDNVNDDSNIATAKLTDN